MKARNDRNMAKRRGLSLDPSNKVYTSDDGDNDEVCVFCNERIA